MTRAIPLPIYSCIFLVAFAAYYLIGYPIFENPDVPWHLATGDLILQTHSIPLKDLWSYTAGETPWLNIEWLWDVWISIVHHLFGPVGLYVMTCSLAALNLVLIAVSLRARKGVSDGFILLMLALIWLAQLAILYPYPQLATIGFACLFHRLLDRHPQSGKLDKHIAMKLFFLMMVWVNTHGGFLVGFILFGAYGIEAYEKRNWAWFRTGCKLVGLCLIACLINPFGLGIILAVKSVLHSSITPYLQDWQPFGFGNELNFTLPLVFFILVSNSRDPNVRLADKILAFAWLLAGLQARRNFVLFTVLSAPYFAYCLQEFMRAVQRQHFKSGEGIFPEGQRASVNVFLAVAFASLLLISPLARGSLLPAEKLDMDPYGVADAVVQLREEHPNVRFINDYNLGGYLNYHGGERFPVFIDGRVGISYPESLFPDFIAFGTASPEAVEVMDRWKVGGALLMHGHPYERVIAAQPAKWQKIYDNGKISAYLRK